MIYAVYVPLLVPLLVAPFARPVASRFRPSVAAATLAVVAGVLAACSTVSLVLLAATHWPEFSLGAEGHRFPAGANPTYAPVASAAALLAISAGVVATAMTIRRASALRSARQLYDGPSEITDDGVRVTMLESPRPAAFSLPPGRQSSGVVVVSTGMLDGLDDAERAVLLAHERSHVVRRHHRLITLTRVSAVFHPALWPLSTAVRFAVERWADEDAAAASHDRRVSAVAVGKAALLAHEYERTASGRRPSAALGVAGVPGGTSSLHRGAVPRRVAALLNQPPPTGRWIVLAGALTALMSGVAAGEGVRDLGHLLALWSNN